MLILKGNEIVDRYILKLASPFVLKGIGVLLFMNAVTALSYFSIKHGLDFPVNYMGTKKVLIHNAFHPGQVAMIADDAAPVLEADKGKQLCFGVVTDGDESTITMRDIKCGFDTGSNTYATRRQILFYDLPFVSGYAVKIPNDKVSPLFYEERSRLSHFVKGDRLFPLALDQNYVPHFVHFLPVREMDCTIWRVGGPIAKPFDYCLNSGADYQNWFYDKDGSYSLDRVVFPVVHIYETHPIWLQELWQDQHAESEAVDWDRFWDLAAIYWSQGQYSRIAHMIRMELK